MTTASTTSPGAETPKESAPGKSYGEILKSSALIGGSSILSIAFGVLRTKAMALFLDPAGYGLLGTYGSISDLTRSLAGLGINSSGVRQIAEAVGTGDNQRIARTVITLRRIALFSGALGALMLVLLSKPVSWLTFGNGDHIGSVALLAVAVFFGDVSAGQGALIQGMRRIADLARMNVLGAFYGTVFSILIVYFYRDDMGVVLSLVCVAAMSILTSWWYARKIKVEAAGCTLKDIIKEASQLVRLGVVFMASGLMTYGVAYLIRVTLLHKIGPEAVGYYQAAWILGGLYMKFILDAMGMDFYPRLTAAANNNPECNRLVNEQAEVGLLMAGPGILATLTFAPIVITLFYSAKFGPATEVLRWICLGMLMRVVSWPMGFIILAKGASKVFFWTELASNLAYAAFVWTAVQFLGIQGAGIAFFALYVLNCGILYVMVRRLSGFRWSNSNLRLALVFTPLVGVVFAARYILPPWWAAILGLAVTIPTGIFSLKTLCKLVPLERFPRIARGPIKWFLGLF